MDDEEVPDGEIPTSRVPTRRLTLEQGDRIVLENKIAVLRTEVETREADRQKTVESFYRDQLNPLKVQVRDDIVSAEKRIGERVDKARDRSSVAIGIAVAAVVLTAIAIITIMVLHIQV